MNTVVLVLGEVSPEARSAMEQAMKQLGHDHIDMVDYVLRSDDYENEFRTAGNQFGIAPSKSYLRWRLTQLLKVRIRYEPPCDLSEVVAVLYEEDTDPDSSAPHWELVAHTKKLHASVYRASASNNGITVELEAVAS